MNDQTNTPRILHLETSGLACSVALTSGLELVTTQSHIDRQFSHAEKLTGFVMEVLKDAGVEPSGLHAVAVSAGPGSYTGLRIGVATAKGLCYALGIPLISVPTHEVMVSHVLKNHPQRLTDVQFLCAMLDARRMEVYAAVYDTSGMRCRDVRAEVVQEDYLLGFREKGNVLFFGDGERKCREAFGDQWLQAEWLADVYPIAEDMIETALRKWHAAEFEDPAYYTPFYLKEFEAKKAKKLI
ncbi:MAG: tRNA (adenosine(37)-N6)-threonylcarbamoyltransferase complex dimerization subunit type 1 TsaB [Flavobacteriales bacterium]|nr:tRNA (adenosine(37)-N6)-threonylcarbamoyltransferase complex dimerization subunit type 1 TsaB [Flavobacteriales bacterium]MCB9449219.1 tRNA (adenosine(37)-N6)-threonylcarbamoyltransferase complex dimerization subunit type 1 TsaB [Flavobacteriales bacterium]